MNMEKYMVGEGVPFQGWIATLDNGDTVLESPAVAGEPLAWRKLLNRCREEALRITSLRLQLYNQTYMAMPDKMTDGYFHAFEVRKKFFRSMGPSPEPEEHFQGIGSVVYDQVFITWVKMGVNSEEMAYSYQEVRSLESSRIHTTLAE